MYFSSTPHRVHSLSLLLNKKRCGEAFKVTVHIRPLPTAINPALQQARHRAGESASTVRLRMLVSFMLGTAGTGALCGGKELHALDNDDALYATYAFDSKRPC